MTEWTLLKRLLEAVHQHSTMIGCLWLIVMVIFRLLVAVATEDVYTDEQDMFVYAFAPISRPQSWVFHIISVSTPSLCFIIYTWHNLSKLPHSIAQRQGPDDITANSPVSLRHVQICSYKEGSADGPAVSGGVLSKCYVFHVCSRAILEVGFVLAQWKLFGFQVSTHFLCSSPPCGQLVDCYVSRPTEKTIFLLFMFCMGVFCILLNVLELNHVGWKKVRQVVRLRERASWRSCPGKRGGYETFTPDSPSHPFSIGLKDKTSTSSLPTLDLVVGHQRDGSCVINCGKMKVHEKVGENIAEQPKRTDSHKSEKQPLKNKGEIRGSKQRSAEVWI
uniref:Gap junction protein n=1 Tax=Mola mola TaxID=94237 RepID=A0A3Q3X4D8_MOLML